MSVTTFYKIRHKTTGLYSKGSSYSNAEGNNSFWGKTGKTWDTLGKLRSHLTLHLPRSKYRPGTNMGDWEIIEFQCAPTSVKGVHEVLDPKKLVELLKV